MEESGIGTEQLITLVSRQARTDGLLTDAAMENLGLQLWTLLGKQTRRYTMGDSSSVPMETAQELLRSIYYCIGVHLKVSGDYGARVEEIKARDLEALFEAGWRDVQALVADGKALLREVQDTALPISNRSYQDTLLALPEFFRLYDLRFFAQDIPCNIDYQLCIPVSGELAGVEYTNAYLRRMLLENRFCGLFDSGRIVLLLRAYCPDYKELLINFFDAVFVNAMGLALLGKDVTPLDIGGDDRAALLALLRPCTRPEIAERMWDAVNVICTQLRIDEGEMGRYLRKAADELVCRVEVTAQAGSFGMLFLTLAVDKVEGAWSFQQGQGLTDEALRKLIEELRDCHYATDKVSLLKSHVYNLKDFMDLLHTCFWEEEYSEVFDMLGDLEIVVILRYLRAESGETIPTWGTALMEYVNRLDASHRLEILRQMDIL